MKNGSTRLYKVTDGEAIRLVDAASAAQAIRHVVGSKYQASAAKTRDVADAMAAGVKVEYAGAEAGTD